MGVNGQASRNVAADQRVIARNRQWIRQTGKHRLSIMFNAGRLTVQDLAGLADIATIGFDNRLMSQADADNR